MGWLWHLTVTDYPVPEIGNLIVIWVGRIASATVLVSSLSFALVTLLPRLATLIKMAILVAWFVESEVIFIVLGDASHAANFSLPAWYINWDPTSGVTGYGLRLSYSLNLGPSIRSEAQLQQLLLSIENKMPDLAGWFAPHLLLAGPSLALVLIAALAFKRSRDVLN